MLQSDLTLLFSLSYLLFTLNSSNTTDYGKDNALLVPLLVMYVLHVAKLAIPLNNEVWKQSYGDHGDKSKHCNCTCVVGYDRRTDTQTD